MAVTAMAVQKVIEGVHQVTRRLVPTQHENGPAQRARDQGTGRLVDVEVVLKSDEQVTQDKDEDEEEEGKREALE